MKEVAKLVIIDKDKNYLMMYRSNHPVFGNDPDLPGGTLEGTELALETMVREVQEEAGIIVDKDAVEEIYSGVEYSAHGTSYTLFITKVTDQPRVDISWEHSAYDWLSRDVFLAKAKNANDSYMHMVSDALTKMGL
jgi:8-oxo-dGTP pyrophosphatase MutT (NUDIX family)